MENRVEEIARLSVLGLIRREEEKRWSVENQRNYKKPTGRCGIYQCGYVEVVKYMKIAHKVFIVIQPTLITILVVC